MKSRHFGGGGGGGGDVRVGMRCLSSAGCRKPHLDGGIKAVWWYSRQNSFGHYK